MLDLRRRKLDRFCVSVSSQSVDDRTAGIAQSQKLRDFVKSLAGCIVASVANIFVGPRAVFFGGQIEMRVASRNHQSKDGKSQVVIALLPLLEQHGVNVPLQMVH